MHIPLHTSVGSIFFMHLFCIILMYKFTDIAKLFVHG